VQARARRLALSASGFFHHPPSGKDWILFPFYHWVLDDEQKAFARQLRWLGGYGDFLSLDDAVAAMAAPEGIKGRYFCLTFDDGFRNWATNALPVLKQAGVPATFFVPSRYIGLDLDTDWDEIAPFYQRSWAKYRRYFEFLTWDDCREMVREGFTVGSHTHSHVRLASLPLPEAEREMADSKRSIEEKLHVPCRHFCCPWGRPGADYDPQVHPEMARRVGYASFLTTVEGPNYSGQSPFAVRRNDVSPDQGRFLFRWSVFR